MSRNDLEYYQRRERQERDLADRASDSAARRVHLTMAEHFETLMRSAANGSVA